MPDRLEVGAQIQLHIDKMSIGSGGVGRWNDLVVFVPRSAPHETVLVEIVQVKDQFARGKLLQVLEPSPSRVNPPCKFVTECGGCPWQHLSYDEQLIQKQNVVNEQLSRTLKRDIPLLPIVGSSEPFRYRHRVRLKFQGQKFGYFKSRSHQLVPIDDCVIVNKQLIEAANNLSLNRNQSFDTEFEFLLNEENQIISTDLSKNSGTFTQANRSLNTTLVSTAIEWLSESKPNKIFDLYSGAGNFSFAALKKNPHTPLIGIESFLAAVEIAQKKAKQLGLSSKQVRFYSGRVEQVLEILEIPADSSVLLDPPRDGCENFVMETLAKSSPKTLIYVSCHPSSLARDLKTFFQFAPSHYRLKKVQAFDMFPQTEHVETIVEIGT